MWQRRDGKALSLGRGGRREGGRERERLDAARVVGAFFSRAEVSGLLLLFFSVRRWAAFPLSGGGALEGRGRRGIF